VDRAAIASALERAARPGRPRLEVLGSAPRRPGSVGLVAGSFDPMTVAHARLVGALGANLTLLLFSSGTLPKERGPGGEPSPPLLGPQERVASLLAHAASRQGVMAALCSHGLFADQAEAAASAFPHSRLVFGVGSDKVLQLFDPAWYEDREAALGRLFGLAEVAYAVRAGDEGRVEALVAREVRWRDRIWRIDLAPEVAAISSRRVREAIRRAEDVAGLVPPEVLPFVRRASISRPPGA